MSSRTITLNLARKEDGTKPTPAPKPETRVLTPDHEVSPMKPRQQDGGSYVGFANLPNQVHRKSVKKGFEFTLMVVGESGLGKSTLVDSLFLTNLYNDKQFPPATDRIKQTVKIVTSTVEIEEKGVRLRLTVVDTPGYGDAVDNSNCWYPIIDFINEQYEAYLHDESGLNRRNIVDNRVHCCVYFINPVGHGLKPIDVMFMKMLHEKVNIVPVIAKADMLTKDEVKDLKKRILKEIADNEVKIYQFPQCDSEDEEEFVQINSELKANIPFAVVGSIETHTTDNRKVRGRAYPWGVVDVENPDHCDFVLLRNMLIRTHMQDLKDVTQEVHYENFRAQRLAGRSTIDDLDKVSHDSFERKSDETDYEKGKVLAEKEAELARMKEMVERMQQQIQRQKHS